MTEAQRVSTPILHAYGSMSLPLAAAFIALQVLVPTFYAENTGLSLSAIGMVLLAARLWDMFTDPVIGLLSDRTPFRLGKRKSWVLLSVPAIALSTYMLFVPPENVGWAYLLCWTFAIYVAGTMAIVPINAWGAEMSPLYDERSRITGIRAFYGLSGTLIALGLAAMSSQAGSQDLQSALQSIVVLVICTLIPTCFLAVACVPDNATVKSTQAPFLSMLQLLRQRSPFRQLLLAFLLNNIGNAIPATLFLLYVTYVLRAPEHAGSMLFLYFICAAAAIPVWMRIARRREKHHTWQLGVLIACAAFIWAPLLGPDQLIWFYILVAVTGFAVGADLVLPVAIKGDLIEWDEYQHGLRRPGLFFAAWGTVTKLAYALAIGFAFPAVELAGFSLSEAGAGLQSDATTNTSDRGSVALALIYSLPCIGFKLAAVALMRNYPITRTVHEQLRTDTAARPPLSGVQ